jgi:hypothetical protein
VAEQQIATFKLKGWQALVVLALLGGLVAVRVMTFSDKLNDPALMQALNTQLMCEYYPSEVDRLKQTMETGDKAAISKAASSVSADIVIESAKVSSPLLSFSSNKKVVVKVTAALRDDAGLRDRRTFYYRYRYSALTGHYSYQHRSGSMGYYLNFL